MKIIVFHLTFTIFSILLAGCKPGNQYQEETAQLNRYLQKELHQNIGIKRMIYIFIPGTQCENCGRSLGANIDASMHIPLTIFTAINFVNKKYRAHVDYENQMARIPFLKYTNTIVLTENGKIKNIEIFNDTTNIERLRRL